MNDATNSWQRLLYEILNQKGISPALRSKEHEQQTLEYFLGNGRSKHEHDLWRESCMLEDMKLILLCRFNALNPELERRAEINASRSILHQRDESKDDSVRTEQVRQASQTLYEYEQEVDEDGRTEQEMDENQKVLEPHLDRQELEMLAAEEYLIRTFRICPTRPGQVPAERTEEHCTARNQNPVIDWEELLKAVQTSFVSYDRITKAVQRAIGEASKENKTPWPMRSVVSDYQIFTLKNHPGKGRPTPAHCLYQRISNDK